MDGHCSLLLVIVWCVCSDHVEAGTPDTSVCDPQDFANQAKQQVLTIPLPVLPNQFTVRVECNIADAGTTIDIREWYDGVNDRATAHIYQNGSKVHIIFDYQNDEMLSIVDDDDGAPLCLVQAISTSQFQYLFGLRIFTQNNTERISSPESAFKFGGGIPEVYNGTKVVRGVTCSVWKSCIYWEKDNATIHTTYYFSVPDWNNSVNGTAPVRAHITGTSKNATTTRTFTHVYTFTDYFKQLIGDPTDIFETPHMAYCPNRNSKRPLPTIPDAFSFASEILDPERQTVNYIKEYYDFKMHLFRYDFFPDADGLTPYGTNKLIRIHDFNTGVSYIIDSVLGNCTTGLIDDAGLDAEATVGGGVRIRTKEEFFDLDGVDLQYVGQKKVRGVDADVFTAQRQNWPAGADLDTSWEWSFLTDSWVESVGSDYEFGLPLQFRVVAYVNALDNIYNIFDYNEDRPNIWNYDISPCYTFDQRKDIQFALPGSFQAVVEPNESLFKEFVLLSIIGYIDISPLRVSNLKYSYTKDNILVSFTMLDIAPAGDVQHTKEITLDQASQFLTALINKGEFVVNMDNDTFKDLQTLVAKPYSLKSSGIYLNGAKPADTSGYSAGAMAGLGIAMLIISFGLAIGIFVIVKKVRSGGLSAVTDVFTSGFAPKRFDETEMKPEEGEK